MKKLLVICGPTASGKTALAVECAKRLNGEVVSCDALLVYRGLDIGTAKPTLEERQGVAHHLIDVVDPTADFSVSDYEKLAVSAIEDIAGRGKLPILCGGTGFYLKAVLFPESFGNTPADADIRAKYERLVQEEGRHALHERLAAVDPESAAILHENDVKRVIRALEIFEVTGRKKSSQHDDAVRYSYAAFGFRYPRALLYERIGRRVDEMLERGLVQEVEGLLAQGVPPNARCMQGIGYKEVVEFLKSEDLHSTMPDIIKKNTRNYAKRQETFFKKMNVRWLEPQPVGCAAEEVIHEFQ